MTSLTENHTTLENAKNIINKFSKVPKANYNEDRKSENVEKPL